MNPRFPMILALIGAVISVITGHSHAPTPNRVPRDRAAALTEHQVLEHFASSYVRLLDGRLEAKRLPGATSGVRALAGLAGAIPPPKRRGPLALTSLRHAPSGAHSYFLTARGTAHTFYAQLTLGHRGNGWLVDRLNPPDFVQALAHPTPAPPPATARIAHVRAAARRFLDGYLPWLYGHGPARSVTAVSEPLRTSLKGRRPRVPPTIDNLHPQVAAIGIQRQDQHWRALANINDGGDTYELDLTVADQHGRWIVTNVSSPG
jgi:hypothetical protein